MQEGLFNAAGVSSSVLSLTGAVCLGRLLRRRLLDPQGAGMALRPELEAARAKLYKQLSTTVERPGANTSYLIIGARGTGKTVVGPLINTPRNPSANPCITLTLALQSSVQWRLGVSEGMCALRMPVRSFSA